MQELTTPTSKQLAGLVFTWFILTPVAMAQQLEIDWIELVPEVQSGGSRYGQSFAVDGDLVAVGAGVAETVTLFRFEDDDWRRVGTIAAPTNMGETTEFGVNMVFTPTRLVVAARAANGAEGRLFVYQRLPDDMFALSQVLDSPTRGGRRMGTRLISYGEILVASAPFGSVGAVFVFQPDPITGTYNSTTNVATLDPDQGHRPGFGLAAFEDVLYVSESGHHVATYDLTTFPPTRTGVIDRVGTVENDFGSSIAITESLRLFGGRAAANSAGEAYISTPVGTPLATVAAPAGNQAFFGISSSADGTRFVVGADGEGVAHLGIPVESGYIALYDAQPDSSLALRRVVRAAEVGANNDDAFFGFAVKLNGNRILVGASNRKDALGVAHGGAWAGTMTEGLGGACATDAECANELCVDGVCCASVCDGVCESCDGSVTEALSGTCAPISAGTDPDSECPDTSCGQVCNGMALCVDEICPDGGMADAGTDGGDADAGSMDGGLSDSGQLDGAQPDGGRLDGAQPDGGRLDGAQPDGGRLDGAQPDSGRLDGSQPDGGPTDGGQTDGELVEDSGAMHDATVGDDATPTGTPRPDLGCGCVAAGVPLPSGAIPVWLLLIGLWLSRRRAWAALCCLLVVVAPNFVSAQPAGTLEEAARFFEEGQTAYRSGRFSDAAAAWERSYELSRRPALLHNVYLARRDMGDVGGAVAALRQYLEEASDLAAGDRQMLLSRLRAMESSLHAQQTSSGSDLSVTETAQEPPPTGTTESPTAESPPPLAEPPARSSPPDTPPSASAPETPGAPRPLRRWRRTGGALLAVGGVSAVLTLVFGLRAANDRDHIFKQCSVGPGRDECPASLNLTPYIDSFKRNRGVAWAVGATGLASLALGTLFLVLGRRGGASSREVSGDVSCSPRGCQVRADIAF